MRASRGFTLIEMLLVLLVVGIVMAGIGLATGGFRQRDLEFEAERIAQLFSLAREEAQVRGSPIRIVADERGYRFEAFTENQWSLLRDDEMLRGRVWEAQTDVKIETPDRPGRNTAGQVSGVFREPTRTIEFGREQLDLPFTMRLSRELSSVTVFGDGMGRFRVERVTVPAPR
jgi:general secretion pathway protein H